MTTASHPYKPTVGDLVFVRLKPGDPTVQGTVQHVNGNELVVRTKHGSVLAHRATETERDGPTWEPGSWVHASLTTRACAAFLKKYTVVSARAGRLLLREARQTLVDNKLTEANATVVETSMVFRHWRLLLAPSNKSPAVELRELRAAVDHASQVLSEVLGTSTGHPTPVEEKLTTVFERFMKVRSPEYLAERMQAHREELEASS